LSNYTHKAPKNLVPEHFGDHLQRIDDVGDGPQGLWLLCTIGGGFGPRDLFYLR